MIGNLLDSVDFGRYFCFVFVSQHIEDVRDENRKKKKEIKKKSALTRYQNAISF